LWAASERCLAHPIASVDFPFACSRIRLVFVPGGQSDLQATEHLNAMNRAWCTNKALFGKYTAERENDKAVA
jgi:fructose-bisphosphate aldolase class 1